MVIADRGYDSNHIRFVIKRRGGTPVIPGKVNCKEPILADTITCVLRNWVERCFNKLKCSRRLSTRYDKTAASYILFIYVAAAWYWERSLSTWPRMSTSLKTPSVMTILISEFPIELSKYVPPILYKVCNAPVSITSYLGCISWPPVKCKYKGVC